MACHLRNSNDLRLGCLSVDFFSVILRSCIKMPSKFTGFLDDIHETWFSGAHTTTKITTALKNVFIIQVKVSVICWALECKTRNWHSVGVRCQADFVPWSRSLTEWHAPYRIIAEDAEESPFEMQQLSIIDDLKWVQENDSLRGVWANDKLIKAVESIKSHLITSAVGIEHITNIVQHLHRALWNCSKFAIAKK